MDIKKENWILGQRAIVLVVAIIISFIAFFVTYQYKYTLAGDFSQYLQPGGMFAAPNTLSEHGFKATRSPSSQATGWDGQFYYYLSDDPLLLKDTEKHLDGPKFRSARIGFPFFVKIMAEVTGQKWVSPEFYFFISVVVILLGAYAAARILQRNGCSVYPVLFWGMSGTILYSVLFGFTDAMADAFALLGLAFLLHRKYLFYSASMTLAVLSRENFVVLPAIIGGVVAVSSLWEYIHARWSIGNALWNFIKRIIPHTIPILFLFGWKLHLVSLYGGVLTDASAFFGLPYVASVYFMTGGFPKFLSAYVPDCHIPQYSNIQAIGLALFIAITASSLLLSAKSIYRWMRTPSQLNPLARAETLGMALGLSFMVFMYACFDAVMVWAPIGYVKASGLILLNTALVCSISKTRLPLYIVALFIITNAFYSYVIVTHF